MTNSRRRAFAGSLSVTGGGGSTPTLGNLVIGPDFGDQSGNDDITFHATAQLTMPSLTVTRQQAVNAALTMPSLTVTRPQAATAHLSATASGAPFWQSEAHATSITTTVTVNKPSGTVAGDLLIAWVGSLGLVDETPTLPSGWTQLRHGSVGTGTLTNGTLAYLLAGSSEPATYDFTTAAASTKFGEIHRIAGVDQTTPIDVSAVATLLGTALDPDPDAPTVTTTVTNTLVMAFIAHDHLALQQTHSPGASHIEVTDYEAANNVSTLFIGSHAQWRVFASAAATGTIVHDCTETVSTNCVMARVAIRPGTLVLAA